MSLKIEDFPNFDEWIIENNILKSKKKFPDITGNLSQVILDALNSNPNHVALIDANTGEQSTFAEIKDRSIRCALWLKDQKIECGHIIVNCTRNHLNACIPMLATFYVGATFNAWDNNINLQTARHLMHLYAPSAIFCDEKAADILIEAAKLENQSPKFIIYGKYDNILSYDNIIQQQSNEAVQSFSPQIIKNPEKTVAIIILTSGSTGIPKGAVYSYELVLKITVFCNVYVTKDIVLWYGPAHGILEFRQAVQCILVNGTRIIHDESTDEEICKVIEKYKVQRLILKPCELTVLYKKKLFKKYKCKSLKYVIYGGYKISEIVLKEIRKDLPHAFVFQKMGMTESGRSLIQQSVRSSVDATGYLSPNVQMKVISLETGEILGPNKSGELYFKTPTVMLGYYKNLKLTQETIDEEGWLHSGDKGFYNENGEVYIMDRIKDLIRGSKNNVSAAEIEKVLMTHSAVMEVGVVPVFHDLTGDEAMAFVTKVPGATVTEEELIQLSSTLGELKKLWGGVKFLNALPKTANGKISKVVLKEMAKALPNNNEQR